jgi:hypothetical protein
MVKVFASNPKVKESNFMGNGMLIEYFSIEFLQ